MTDRPSKDNSTGLAAYFQALREIFALQTRVLTGALPHYGERGRNDEQRVAKFLQQVLPHQYSLGTGFIVSSHGDLPASSQVDIVIHDELINSPLFRELAANIFPIESVYASVEVKADLTLDKLREAAAAISVIRQMAGRGKFYSRFGVVATSVNSSGDLPQGGEVHVQSTLAPRSYLVGYDANAENPDAFVARLADLLREQSGVFFHGIYAIRQDWFFCQQFRQTTFDVFTENGLLSFVSKMISDLQSFPMKPLAFGRYVENNRLKGIVNESKGNAG